MPSRLGVELARVGTWPLRTGTRTFTLADFEDAVAASQDPEFGAPRIRPGHVDPRFDGQPALGRVENMRIVGDRLVGDLTELPKWLASAAGRAAYPDRSIDGYVGVTASSGRKYRLVISRLSLLGASEPAMTGLADLPAAIAATGAVPIAASAASMGLSSALEPAMPTPMPNMPMTDDGGPDPDEDPGALAQAVDAILDEVQEALAIGDMASAVALLTGAEATIDSLLALLGVPDADDVPNGPPVMSGATSASRPKPAGIVSASRNEGRKGVARMDHAAALRKALGLAETATDEEITAAIATRDAAAAEGKPEGGKPAATTAKPAGDKSAKPATATAPVTETAPLPGTVTVDAAAWAEVQRQAADGALAASRMREQERGRFIGEVVRAGRLSAANTELRASLEREWDRDPVTAAKVAAGLAVVVPTAPMGHAEAGTLDADDALYASLFGEPKGA